ncbi:hypothetical protein [Kocuria rosea]|uniref:hypothetical protein n=1 Tax=Kocuria rosea TaxID=1275 RepID=UPI002041B55D|nr:hypothetical protein [Kocuria rosea]MCM3687832.1 hypothetical protein [Kocuria rosea]
MIPSSQRKSTPAPRCTPVLLTVLGWVVVPTGLYLAGVPWAVSALDAFWEGVDHLGRYSELLWAVTGLSWAGTTLFLLYLQRLTRWNQRVDAALRAAAGDSGPERERGRAALAELSRTRGIPRQDRKWVELLLAIVSLPHRQNPPGGCDHDDQQ